MSIFDNNTVKCQMVAVSASVTFGFYSVHINCTVTNGSNCVSEGDVQLF